MSTRQNSCTQSGWSRLWWIGSWIGSRPELLQAVPKKAQMFGRRLWKKISKGKTLKSLRSNSLKKSRKRWISSSNSKLPSSTWMCLRSRVPTKTKSSSTYSPTGRSWTTCNRPSKSKSGSSPLTIFWKSMLNDSMFTTTSRMRRAFSQQETFKQPSISSQIWRKNRRRRKTWQASCRSFGTSSQLALDRRAMTRVASCLGQALVRTGFLICSC